MENKDSGKSNLIYTQKIPVAPFWHLSEPRQRKVKWSPQTHAYLKEGKQQMSGQKTHHIGKQHILV